MPQNAFAAGVPPGPRWGSLQRSPDPLAGFEGVREKRGCEGRKGSEEMEEERWG